MAFKPIHPNTRQCTATAKRTGQRCEQCAVTGYDVCRAHGAHKKKKPGDPPKKTTNGLKSGVLRKYKNKLNKTAEELGVDLAQGLRHGFLAFDIMTEEERRDFLGVVKQMHDDFKLNKSSDFYAVELVATNLVLYRRAVKKDDVKAAEAYDRMVRMHLGDLKATKSAREGETVNVKTTPAEWAAAILKGAKEDVGGEMTKDENEVPSESEITVVFDEGEDAGESDKTATGEV